MSTSNYILYFTPTYTCTAPPLRVIMETPQAGVIDYDYRGNVLFNLAKQSTKSRKGTEVLNLYSRGFSHHLLWRWKLLMTLRGGQVAMDPPGNS